MVATVKKPDMGQTDPKHGSKNEDKVKQVVEQIVEKCRELLESNVPDSEAWYSVVVKDVQGSTTELVLQFSVNPKMKAVMYAVRTPLLRGKPNMIKLPTLEHVRLFIELAEWMKQKLPQLEKLYVETCQKLGIEPERRRRTTVTRTEIEL